MIPEMADSSQQREVSARIIGLTHVRKKADQQDSENLSLTIWGRVNILGIASMT